MRLRNISADQGRCHLLLLLIIGFAGASMCVDVSETLHEETPAAKQFSAREGTTSASLNIPIATSASDRKLTSPIVVEDAPRNRSNVFRPSVHLGEIEQTSTIRTTPFNNVQHVKFESNVRLDTRYGHYQDVPQDVPQDAYQSVSSVLDEATRPSRIKFEDDRIVQTPSSVHHTFDDQRTVETDSSSPTSPLSPFEETGVRHVFVDQMFFQSAPEKTEAQDASAIYGTPTATGDHRLTVGSYLDASRPPYVVTYYADNNQNAYRPLPQGTTYEAMKKPDGDVLVLQQQESTYTRKRKFPYQFYQPVGEYHGVEFVEEPRQSTAVAYPPMRKLSPWKKIIHLIGTFLPLGLLLATLAPKIVRIDNTTQPNIVLSKLRVADLPVEHKRARLLDDQQAVCEDRSICELIVAGGEPGSNILQNALWNLATRISDDVAKRSGLRGVFNAVKNKDCTTISC